MPATILLLNVAEEEGERAVRRDLLLGNITLVITNRERSDFPVSMRRSLNLPARLAFGPQSCSRAISAVHSHTFMCSFTYAHVHIWEIESTHILSSVGSNVPLHVSWPGGTLGSGPVHRQLLFSASSSSSVPCYSVALPCATFCDTIQGLCVFCCIR